MREIKFRFFATDKSRMIYPKFLKFSGTDLEENDTWKVMQYTGLKDKNGKEIYEGDIVRILYTDWISKSADDPRTLEQYLIDKSMLAEVVFNEDCYCLKIKDKKYGDYSFCSIFPGKYGFIEVIGNTWQTPELLEAK